MSSVSTPRSPRSRSVSSRARVPPSTVCLDTWNVNRIVAEHSGRADLIEHVRKQAGILCDVADQLNDQGASVLVPSLLLSNDAPVLDQPMPLAGLIDGLAENHVPGHTKQLLDLRATVPQRT